MDNGVPARTLVPTDPSGYTVCGRAYISNTTDHTLSVTDLTDTFDAGLTDERTPDPDPPHPRQRGLHPAAQERMWSGPAIYRTTDSRYNVVQVGDEMADVFSEAGISVLHDRTLYDYPSYNEAYDRSLAAIESYLAQYPSLRFILDVHRDAIEDSQGNQYKVVSTIDGVGTAAQLTLVVGSDGSGLPHAQLDGKPEAGGGPPGGPAHVLIPR